MRIIVFSNCRPALTGGAEKYFYTLCERLSKGGNTVLAIFPASRGAPDRRITDFECISLHGPDIKGYSLAIVEIMKIIKAFNPDVIHLADGLSPTDAILILAVKISLRKPLFIDVVAFYRFIGFNILARLTLPLYMLTDGVICSNPNLKKSVLRWTLKRCAILNYYTEYMDVPAPFVELDMASVDNVFKLLFVGVLDSNHIYKGLDLLIKALKYLENNDVKSYRKMEIVIVGDGDMRDFYEQKIKNYNLTGIIFKGQITGNDLNDMYRNSTGLILPSKKTGEGFGKVVLESLMNGTPVLISRYAGAAYLISEYKVGMIVDPYETKNFAKQMVEFIKSIKERAYEDAIKKFQKEFSHVSKDSYEKLIQAYTESIKHQVK